MSWQIGSNSAGELTKNMHHAGTWWVEGVMRNGVTTSFAWESDEHKMWILGPKKQLTTTVSYCHWTSWSYIHLLWEYLEYPQKRHPIGGKSLLINVTLGGSNPLSVFIAGYLGCLSNISQKTSRNPDFFQKAILAVGKKKRTLLYGLWKPLTFFDLIRSFPSSPFRCTSLQKEYTYNYQ